MLEIRIHGRGGQGAQVACQILAGAFFRAGEYVQAFAAYGGERRGAPVTAFLRADERPIRIRCDIERPHYILVLDPTMLSEVNVAAGLREGGLMLVNAAVLPANALPAHVRVLPVDAAAIARRACLGPMESRAFPLFEVEDGLRYTITREPAGIPVAEYLRAQQRYAHLTDAEVAAIQAEVDFRWAELLQKAGGQA